MPIVAVSMPESDLRELERLRERGGFSSRSEVVRRALQVLNAEHRRLDELAGQVTVIVAVTYSVKGRSATCDRVQHEHTRLLNAVIHSHTCDGACMDVMVATGESEEIRSFVNNLRTQRDVAQIFVNIVEEG